MNEDTPIETEELAPEQLEEVTAGATGGGTGKVSVHDISVTKQCERA